MSGKLSADQSLNTTPKPAISLSQPGILQRTCACGGVAGLTGECEECSSKRLSGQGRINLPNEQPIESTQRSPLGTYNFGQLDIQPKERFGIQTKLAIGQPGDKYEQEADRVAEQVMRLPEPKIKGVYVGQEEKLQRQSIEEEDEEKTKQLQMKSMSGGSSEASPELQAQITNLQQGGGQPLSVSERAFLETRFGQDFSGVRIHRDTRASEMAKSLNARAFTIGRDVVFGAGQYQPESSEGQRLLAHELTHVVQQTGAISPKTTSEQPTIEQVDNFHNEKLSENPHSFEVSSASAIIQKREVCDSSGVCWSEAEPEESTYGDEPNATYSADVGTLTESTTKQEEDPNKPIFEEYKGQSINKVGYVSSRPEEYEIAKTIGVNVRAKPDGTLPHIAKVLYGTKVQVQASDNTNAFYFIISDTGAVGWINKKFVALDPPDPRARLHHITESDLTTILKNEYVDKSLWTLSTGNDYTTLAAAVVVANKGRIGVDVKWDKVQKYKEEEAPLYKQWFDPWTIDNFAIYHGSKILKGHNIWLPSPDYVRILQSSGVIGSRPGWINTAVDIGKGITGFTAGIISGIFGSLWDTLTGLWELGKGIVSTIKSAIDGSLFESIKSIYDTVTNMTWKDLSNIVDQVITMGKNAFNDFENQWEGNNAPGNEYKKWHFRGYTIGAIALEVVLAIFTGGSTLGAKVLAKIGKYFPKLMKVLNILLTKADDLNFRRRGKNRGDKSKNRDDDRDRDQDNENMSKADREWEQARVMAAFITEEHDVMDTPVDTLIPMLNKTIAARFKGVRGYRAIPIGAPNTYKIIQMARRRDVDKHYTAKKDNQAEIEQVRSEIRRLLKSPFLKRGKFAQAGGSIATNYPDIKDVPSDERRKINEFGELYGDHHTGVPKPGTKRGWIPDHIPVTGLVRTAQHDMELKRLMKAARLPITLSRQRLYPHSLPSALTQGGVVTGIIGKLKKLKRLKLQSKKR